MKVSKSLSHEAEESEPDAGNGKPLNFIIQNDPFRDTFGEGNSLGYMGKRLELEENEVRKATIQRWDDQSLDQGSGSGGLP